jgi:hypothetical protein
MEPLLSTPAVMEATLKLGRICLHHRVCDTPNKLDRYGSGGRRYLSRRRHITEEVNLFAAWKRMLK